VDYLFVRLYCVRFSHLLKRYSIFVGSLVSNKDKMMLLARKRSKRAALIEIWSESYHVAAIARRRKTSISKSDY